jgi:hypothetical protein
MSQLYALIVVLCIVAPTLAQLGPSQVLEEQMSFLQRLKEQQQSDHTADTEKVICTPLLGGL